MTSMKIKFKLHGADAELMRALQNWLRQNSEPGQPGHGLPQDPDEIAQRAVINFLYGAVAPSPSTDRQSSDGAGDVRSETNEGNPEVVGSDNAGA
jgi:hypothetical protein